MNNIRNKITVRMNNSSMPNNFHANILPSLEAI